MSFDLENWFEIIKAEIGEGEFERETARLVLRTDSPTDCWIEVDNPHVFFYFRKPYWDKDGALNTFIVSAGNEGIKVRYNNEEKTYPITSEFLIFLQELYEGYMRRLADNA